MSWLVIALLAIVAVLVYQNLVVSSEKTGNDEDESVSITEHFKYVLQQNRGAVFIGVALLIAAAGILVGYWITSFGFITPFGQVVIVAGITGVALYFYIEDAVQNIPSMDPPHRAVLMVFGDRVVKENAEPVDEGRHLFPLHGLGVYEYGLVKYQRETETFPAELVLPDGTNVTIPVSITFLPDENNLAEFINTGGKEGVIEALKPRVEERIKKWALTELEPEAREITNEEGEVIDTIEVYWRALLKAGDMPSRQVLLNLIRDPREDGSEKEGLTEEEEEVLRGEQPATIGYLGIEIDDINIGNIGLPEKLSEASSRVPVEEEERKAEKREIDHIIARVKDLHELELSDEARVNLVQTERGKVEKLIEEHTISLGEGAGKVLDSLGEKVVSVLLSKAAEDEKGGSDS